MTIIDLLGIVIILLYTIGGYGKGFIRGFASTVQYILGFVVAKVTSPIITEWVYQGYMEETIRGKVFTVVDITVKNTMGESLEVVRDSIIQSVETKVIFGKTIAEKMNTNWSVYSTLKEGGKTMSANITNGIMEQIEPMMIYILGLIFFVILFIVARVVFAIILGVLSNILNALSITRFMDSILGLVLGGMKGVIAATLVVTLLYVAVNLTGDIGPYITQDAFTGSKIFSVARSFTNI